MTIKNIVIRKKLEGTATEILYPVTSIENVTGLSSLLTTINTNLEGKSDIGHKHEWYDINAGGGDRTYVGPDEPSSNFFTKWIKTTGDEVDVEIEENSIEADFEEIETEPLLNEIESGELKGDEIITPPQFE